MVRRDVTLGRTHGFTLIELLIVMAIMLMVAAAAARSVYYSHAERGVMEGARLVGVALAGARDEAVRTNSPHGIRFLPDPVLVDAANRLIPIAPAPDYSEGLVGTFPDEAYPQQILGGTPCLVLEQYPIVKWLQHGTSYSPEPAAETSWWSNIRVGDRVRLASAGPRMTVCGPVATDTSEGFTGAAAKLTRVYTAPDGKTVTTREVEYLLLTNGIDDDKDGFIDNGHDGIDNNGNGVVDELAEWEAERWPAPAVLAASYTIRRRPVPARPSAIVDLPGGVVIDSVGLPAEFLVAPTGEIQLTGKYAEPGAYYSAGVGADRRILHEMRIHLVERGKPDNEAWVIVNLKTGQVTTEIQSP